jgi:tRNA U34 5-methylaminomethyl-2-thiouridine-forming methyltransferase MnmC
MREIVITKDGSHTISIPEQKVTYHSVHGAIQESMHVFIETGLRYLLNRSITQPVAIFEMGFGTGLNAFLTAIVATETKTIIHVTSVESWPLRSDETAVLNYPHTLGYDELFQKIHQCRWEEEVAINDFFSLQKVETELMNFSTTQPFSLIYFDAFAPSAQPELWTEEVFKKLYGMLLPSGVLVTYCSKGDVRRAMIAAGFTVKKLPGPPGKREILRGEKLA